MKPILFPEGQKDFSTNGLGRLPDAISCKVTEERNGQYTSAVFYAGSPLGKGEGKILVPRSMVASYKADSTWGAYAAEIYAIEDYPELAE